MVDGKAGSIKRGYIYIIISAVIFGCMPLMARYIYAEGVNSITLVWLRNVISLPFLFGLGILFRESFAVKPKDAAWIVVIGTFGCAITPFLLFSSYNYINGGVATVFHFVYPAVVLLLEFIFLRSRIRWASAVAIALCVLGICLFYNPGESFDLTGSALALSSGVTYAVYIFLLGKFKSNRIGGYVFSFFATLGSSVILMLVCLLSGELSLPTSILGWVLCCVFAVAVNVGAVVLFQRGTFIIGGQRASILSTFEPITGLIVGYIAFGETSGPLAAIGSLLVIAASVLIAVLDKRESGKDKESDDA